jgi:hypothetical protein
VGHTQADVDTATRHVVEAEVRIRRVEGLVAKYHELGSEGAALGESLLRNMRDSLSVMRDHKAHLEAEIMQGQISN